jgi:hypothetical protein
MKLMTDLAKELAANNYNVTMIYLEDSSYVNLIKNTSIIPIMIPGYSQEDFDNQFEKHRVESPGQPAPLELLMGTLKIS